MKYRLKNSSVYHGDSTVSLVKVRDNGSSSLTVLDEPPDDNPNARVLMVYERISPEGKIALRNKCHNLVRQREYKIEDCIDYILENLRLLLER